jgi:transposase
MIRIDEIWLSTQPMDMRAGMDTAMAQVLKAFGSSKPHCAYLFCNKRGHRMKVLVHDGLGIWLFARRLEQGKFQWAQVYQGETISLSLEQLQALIEGFPLQRIGQVQVVTTLSSHLVLLFSKGSIASYLGFQAYYAHEYDWTATTLLDKYRLFFLHRREHYEWTTIHPRV